MDELRKCLRCQVEYSTTKSSCPICDFNMNSQTVYKKCQRCQFQNDDQNKICVACDYPFKQQNKQQIIFQQYGSQILKYKIPKQLSKNDNSFSNTGTVMKQLNNNQQAKHLQLKSQVQKQDELNSSSWLQAEEYPYSMVILPEEIKPKQLFSYVQLLRLTNLQKNIVMFMQERSLQEHRNAIKPFEERVIRLGYNVADFQNLLAYIEYDAPIIIHMHVTKHMQFFIKDTHYRSQFETNKSSGTLCRTTRTDWEDRIFCKKYANAYDLEKVKYGVVNFTNDPKGVSCALGYGLSYFVLNKNVRNRCTVTDMDSSAACSIGTLKFCAHVLNKMSDNQLKAAFKAARGSRQSSSVTVSYKQVQVHGPIQFSKDIQKVFIHKTQIQNQNNKYMVQKFCQIHKLRYQLI